MGSAHPTQLLGQVGGQVAVAGLLGRIHIEGRQGIEGEFARGAGGNRFGD